MKVLRNTKANAKAYFAILLIALLLFLHGAFADCLYMGDLIVKDGEMIPIDCVMLHGTTLEYVENSGRLICKGTELYFANEMTTNHARKYTCDCEAAYGYHHPWHFLTAVASAVYTNTEVCRGSKISVTLPKQFSIVCIDGSVHTGYPSFFVGMRKGNEIEVLGHNCNGGFSSSQCNTLFQQGANATVTIPFVPLEQKTLDVFAAMQTKYDYQITAAHLPFGIVEAGTQTLKLIDPEFDLSADKENYCESDSIKISGKSVCCGDAGTDVTINIKDSTGNILKSTTAKITSDNKYSATLSLGNLQPGYYSLEAIAPFATNLPACKKTISFAIRTPELNFGTEHATVTSGSTLKISGTTQCCAAPNEKAKITLTKDGTTIVSTEAEINASGQFNKPITVPSNETGPMEISVGFANANPSCNKKASILAIFPDVLKTLVAEDIKEGERARVSVECTSNIPVKIKIYSYYDNNLVAEQNYTCNSGIAEIGPPLKAGIYDVRAEADVPFCIQCKLQSYFTVKGISNETIPEMHTALIVFCAIAALLVARAKRGD